MSRLHELGPVRAAEVAEVDGGIMVNVAAAIQMAEEGGTPQCKIVVREFWQAYDQLGAVALSEKQRQLQAFRTAMAAIGVTIAAPPAGTH